MATAPKKIPSNDTGYCVIRIQAKREANEPNDVSVCVNGRNYVFQRERLIPVSGEVVEALRHAVYPVYRQTAGEERKLSGRVARYPFEVVERNLTQEGFEALRELARRQPLTEDQVARVVG